MNRRGFLGSCLAAVFGAGATRGSGRTVSGDALLGEQTTFSSAGVPLPSVEDLRRLSQAEGWSLADADLAVFRETMSRLLAGYPALESTPEPALPPRYPRTGTTRPTPKDNPLNAWAVKTSIKGASRGLLSGRTVAVKDNVCVAGVPMMNGSCLLDGFVPATDASIITRLLDAGAEIVGKAICEAFCFSAGSTQQFDVTGHPAISVPCGKIGRMPGGMMLVGRHGEDTTVLRAAHAFEQLGTA